MQQSYSYPPRGTLARSLPSYRTYYRGGRRYYFNAGVWYAARGAGFVVVAPPIGILIPTLPPYYTTVVFAGIPYYYADDVYYAWQPDQNGYAVVPPPDGAAQPEGAVDAPGSAGAADAADASDASDSSGGTAASTPPGEGPDLVIYPKNGQSKDQLAADESDCGAWATGQTGFDPQQPGGGVAAEDADRTHGYYDRALAACLQGRGYQLN